MKRSIVFGASGFIGRAVVCELLREQEVYAIVHTRPISIKHPNLHIIYMDLNCFDDSIFPDNINYVFDFAWSGTSGISRRNLILQISNVFIREKIVNLCSKLNCRYIGAGSIMEIESIKSTFDVESKCNTMNYYAHAKYLAHAVSKSKALESGVEYVWGRITNAYGPGEESARLISSTISLILKNEVPAFSSGIQVYDFVFISDLAKEFVAIAEKGKSFEDYVLGSGNPKPLKVLLEEMNQILAPNIEFTYTSEPDCSKILNKSEYSIEKLLRDTGYYPKMSFENGLRDTYSWYVSRG